MIAPDAIRDLIWSCVIWICFPSDPRTITLCCCCCGCIAALGCCCFVGDKDGVICLGRGAVGSGIRGGPDTGGGVDAAVVTFGRMGFVGSLSSDDDDGNGDVWVGEVIILGEDTAPDAERRREAVEGGPEEDGDDEVGGALSLNVFNPCGVMS